MRLFPPSFFPPRGPELSGRISHHLGHAGQRGLGTIEGDDGLDAADLRTASLGLRQILGPAASRLETQLVRLRGQVDQVWYRKTQATTGTIAIPLPVQYEASLALTRIEMLRQWLRLLYQAGDGLRDREKIGTAYVFPNIIWVLENHLDAALTLHQLGHKKLGAAYLRKVNNLAGRLLHRSHEQIIAINEAAGIMIDENSNLIRQFETSDRFDWEIELIEKILPRLSGHISLPETSVRIPPVSRVTELPEFVRLVRPLSQAGTNDPPNDDFHYARQYPHACFFLTNPVLEGLFTDPGKLSLPQGKALVFAAGLGHEAILLAGTGRFDEIIATDHSPLAAHRLGQLNGRLGGLFFDIPVTAVLANAHSLDLPPGEFSFALVNHGLEFLDDEQRRELLRKIDAAMAPGGVLVMVIDRAEGDYYWDYGEEVSDGVRDNSFERDFGDGPIEFKRRKRFSLEGEWPDALANYGITSATHDIAYGHLQISNQGEDVVIVRFNKEETWDTLPAVDSLVDPAEWVAHGDVDSDDYDDDDEDGD